MEKITLKYECPDTGNDGNIHEAIEMVFDSEGMDIWDLVEKLKRFCIAIGYHPNSIERGFSGEE
jgi:hypothetical protein